MTMEMKLQLPIYLDYIQHVEQHNKIPIAALQALIKVVSQSDAKTVIDLLLEVRCALDDLASCVTFINPLSLKVTCELFLLYLSRFPIEGVEVSNVKLICIEKFGDKFLNFARGSVRRIMEVGKTFVRDNTTILTHGSSSVVLELLLNEAKTKNFKVMVSEGRPSGSGYETAKRLAEKKIPVYLILDCALASIMHQVDSVIIGAEVVLESGGVKFFLFLLLFF
jgi:translation initiation factor eIF-2B subunit alpha